jgi:hypothetical protein
MEQSSIPNETQGTYPDLPEQKSRQGCLTVLLILMIAADSLSTFLYLFKGQTILKTMPNMPGWALYVYGLCSLIGVLCGFAVWKWKKIGVYGFIATTIVIFIFNLALGINIFAAVLGLLGPVLLIILLRPVWSYLD